MVYTGVGMAAAGAAIGSEAGRQLALTGAVVEMVAHGLITGSLFLMAGAFWQRAREYDLQAYGGLAPPAPKLAMATTLADFASLGLTGLGGLVATLQSFAGTFAAYPWRAGIGHLVIWNTHTGQA